MRGLKNNKLVLVCWLMLVQADEHHTQIKNPRSENRGFFTQRSDFIEAIYWIYDIGNPQKHVLMINAGDLCPNCVVKIPESFVYCGIFTKKQFVQRSCQIGKGACWEVPYYIRRISCP